MGRYYEPLLGHRRSQEFVFGDLTSEAPKALRSRRRRRPGGMVWGRGVLLPSRLGVWGSVVSSPAGSGVERRQKWQTSFGEFRAWKNTLDSHKSAIFDISAAHI